MSVTLNGSAVEDATVIANDETVGTTDAGDVLPAVKVGTPASS